MLALAAMALTYLNARNGLRLTPDSLDYLSAGRNIAASGQLATFTGTPLTTFPAGFPATIAAVEWAGANALQVMIWVNVLCAGALVVLANWTATLLCRGRAWGLVAAALVATSIFVQTTFRALWSEPVFAVALMVVVAVLVGALRRHEVRGRDAAMLIVAANVASLYRYIGLALLPAIFLGVWWAGAGRSRGRRLRDAGLITVGAAAGAAVNLLRNAAVADDVMGPRYGSEFGPVTAVRMFADAFAAQFVGQTSALIAALVVALAGATLLVGCTGAWRERDTTFAVVLVVAVSYSAALIVAQLTTRLDPIGNRMFVPLVAPMSLLLNYGWATAWRWRSGAVQAADTAEPGAARRASPLRALVVLTVLLALAGTLVQTVVGVQHLSGRRASADPGADTPLTAAVRALPPATGLASNQAAQLWVRTGRVPIEQLPRDDYYWPPARITDDRLRLERRIASGEISYMAVFDGASSQAERSSGGQPRAAVATLDGLRAVGFGVEVVAEFEDGVLYRIARPA